MHVPPLLSKLFQRPALGECNKSATGNESQQLPFQIPILRAIRQTRTLRPSPSYKRHARLFVAPMHAPTRTGLLKERGQGTPIFQFAPASSVPPLLAQCLFRVPCTTFNARAFTRYSRGPSFASHITFPFPRSNIPRRLPFSRGVPP